MFVIKRFKSPHHEMERAMKRLHRASTLVIWAAIVACVAGAGSVFAAMSMPAITGISVSWELGEEDGIDRFAAGSGATIGWSFIVTEPLYISALGFYDSGNNGLGASHYIGLWDQNGILQVSQIIPAGSGTNRIGDYRYVDIIPFQIEPNQVWTIGATVPIALDDQMDLLSNGDVDLYPFYNVLEGNFAIDPRFILISSALEYPDLDGLGTSPPGHLNFPQIISSSNLTGHFFAPNLVFIVPEPSGLGSLVFATIVFLTRRQSMKYASPSAKA
ncbi:MAG: hypothetical protein IT443_08935 [Phycisphaeraceae bacterium]|nr:hypothetical protein [Phycisphaeraceae bacterium]